MFDNIMEIIRATNQVIDAKGNRDATARHEAVIKRIDFVRIGRSAMGLAGQVTPLGAARGRGVGGMPGGGETAAASPAGGSADARRRRGADAGRRRGHGRHGANAGPRSGGGTLRR